MTRGTPRSRSLILLGHCFIIAMATACDEAAPAAPALAAPGQDAAQPPAAKVPADSSSKGLPRFERLWENAELQHQYEATGVSTRDGWLYVAGGGGLASRASKVRIADGTVAWSVPAGSYQPSYPVSDGRRVILGMCYDGGYRALDDSTGEVRWTTSAASGAFGSALFSGDLAFVGSYNEQPCGIYGLEVGTGKVRWKSPTGEKIWSTPAAYGDLVLVACYDGLLYAVEQATGLKAWSLDCGGRIQSSPVVVADLAFLSVDDQRVTDRYDGSKLRKHFLVVDLREKAVIHKWTTKGEWDLNVVATPQQVFFFDRRELHAYDVRSRALAYSITPPAGLIPYPVLAGDRLLLPVRVRPMECSIELPASDKAPLPIAVYDRATGKAIPCDSGTGITVSSLGHPLFVHAANVLVTIDRRLAAYRLVTE